MKVVLFMSAALFATTLQAGDWKPAENPIMTRWAKEVSPDNVHPEYPRPQMVREKWVNLNGLWDYAIRPKNDSRPEDWDGQILVPFCVESALSGVKKSVGPDKRLWYRRLFTTPEIPDDGSLLLHFGAVDWQSTVWVNGQEVGRHQGGYGPFSCDITDALIEDGEQEVVVSVWDPSDAGYQPRGKQVREPSGIWYTSVTGIWQTVWLEAVPKAYITSLRITPDLDRSQVRIRVGAQGATTQSTVKANVQVKDFELTTVSGPVGDELIVEIPGFRQWSPSDPFLYNLSVVLEDTNDVVTSYFGMRKIEVKHGDDGFNRIFLNNAPLFQYGPLDQGWWPDGLYTAPTDEALRYDIEVTRRLGMNMARKHVKVEPARWYYWCDKLGLMVWQDMPNGDKHIGRDQPDMQRSPESEENFRREFKALIDSRRNHPCIVAWVPFNEGWGQFKTNEILAWTKQYDPTRLVDGPSGWADRGTGDMHDMHSYPGPGMPQPEEDRAVVLGEFGGLGWPVEGHLWWDKRNWGYRTYSTREELQENYNLLMKKLRPLISKGLAAAVYTQTTDVEGEVNGLMTYDREIIKLDAGRLAEMHARFYQPPPVITVTPILATSEKNGQPWRYTTREPGEWWMTAAFDDTSWNEGIGGFGEVSTPGAVVRTDWKSKDIWLRRTFELNDTELYDPHLRIHHDEDAEVYINGRLAAKLTGFVTGYTEVEISNEAREALKTGTNTLAVHCRQTEGGQYIDAGLVDVKETPRPSDSAE